MFTFKNNHSLFKYSFVKRKKLPSIIKVIQLTFNLHFTKIHVDNFLCHITANNLFFT